MKLISPSYNNLKYLASFFFVIIGLSNLIETLITKPQFYFRDFIILTVLSLPIIINRRLFYLFFGLWSSIISLILLIVFIINNNPLQIKISVIKFLLGFIFFTLILICSLILIYIGTYSIDKKRFRIL